MGRKKLIYNLPDAIQNTLDQLITSKRYTQKEITQKLNELLAGMGEKPIMTERIVNRYAASFNDLMAKKRESNEVVKSWIGQLGDIPDGDFGRAIVEILRYLAFDLSLAMHNEEGLVDLPGSAKMLQNLSISVEKLEKAASENEKRAAQIRQQARAEAADELTKELKSDGISAELEASIRRILIGGG